MFESLDFVYVPAADVDAATVFHVESLGAELLWLLPPASSRDRCTRFYLRN
jgi:hypothetical protein